MAQASQPSTTATPSWQVLPDDGEAVFQLVPSDGIHACALTLPLLLLLHTSAWCMARKQQGQQVLRQNGLTGQFGFPVHDTTAEVSFPSARSDPSSPSTFQVQYLRKMSCRRPSAVFNHTSALLSESSDGLSPLRPTSIFFDASCGLQQSCNSASPRHQQKATAQPFGNQYSNSLKWIASTNLRA